MQISGLRPPQLANPPARTRLNLAAALVLIAALACPTAGWAGADLDPGADYVRAELIAAQDAVAPGQAASFAVRLRHAPHWHTYWLMPGDAGLPTQLKWRLDPGFVPGPVQWPVPERLRVGSLANYGYEGTVVLPVSVQVPASAPLGSVGKFAVHVDWLVCNDLCVPGGADLSLALPIRPAASVHAAAGAAPIQAALRRVPMPIALGTAKAVRKGQQVWLEFSGPNAPPHALEFFPVEAGRIEAAAEQVLTVRGQRVRLDLQAAPPIADDFHALRGVLVADGGPGSSAQGWAGTIDLPFSDVRSPLGAASSSLASGSSAAEATKSRSAQAPPLDLGQAPARAAGQPAPREAANTAAAGSGVIAAAIALAGAFLGGMILNLMPCVFPVLSLKLIGLVQHRSEDPARLRRHGAAFTLGVVLSFLALAGLLLAFRAAGSQIGWGFQLQSPLVIAALISLFFLIGLNLLGAFEFTLGSGLINRVAKGLPASGAAPSVDDEGLGGSFATGVLAAVVASPCTAPFMGAALGFAITQSAPLAILVFAALGAGMAAPYFVLTLEPAWLERLPRPGAWMERLKQVMAFPMFLTCVWLFWVLGQQIDMDAVAALLAALVGLGLWAWSTGLVQRGAPRYRWLAGAALVATLAMLTPLLGAVLYAQPRAESGSEAGPARRLSSVLLGKNPADANAASLAPWGHWTPAVQGLALAQGSPVFVDFTAAWCITCQANKRLVLHDARVDEAFREHGVVRLLADWTRRDDAISRELARLQRSGVPVYVLYDRRGVEHVLPEILSIQGVLDALGPI